MKKIGTFYGIDMFSSEHLKPDEAIMIPHELGEFISDQNKKIEELQDEINKHFTDQLIKRRRG